MTEESGPAAGTTELIQYMWQHACAALGITGTPTKDQLFEIASAIRREIKRRNVPEEAFTSFGMAQIRHLGLDDNGLDLEQRLETIEMFRDAFGFEIRQTPQGQHFVTRVIEH